MKFKQRGDAAVVFLLIVAMVVGGWFTHIANCLSDDRWGFLIAGALFFPIGIIHGWGVWFGAW